MPKPRRSEAFGVRQSWKGEERKMTGYGFEISRQCKDRDEIDVDIRWDSYNVISLSLTESQLRRLRSEIECFLESEAAN